MPHQILGFLVRGNTKKVLQVEFGLYIVIKKLSINNIHLIVLDGVLLSNISDIRIFPTFHICVCSLVLQLCFSFFVENFIVHYHFTLTKDHRSSISSM